MNYTKVDNNMVYFRLKDDENWQVISEIKGDDILRLLKLIFEDSDFQIAPYNDDNIKNEVHNIIYKNIYKQFEEIIRNKDNIADENTARYKDVIEKYK